MFRSIVAGTAITLALLAATPALAETRPIQLSLINPIQIFPQGDSVKGIRLNLIYGVNQDVKGLDLGLINHTRGDGKGIQYGPIGLVDGDFTGWQNGIVTMTRGRFNGLQTGFYNGAGTGEMFQWGIINVGKDIAGLQVGIVNVAENLHGLQIGLVNVIKSKDKLPFLPLVNWKF